MTVEKFYVLLEYLLPYANPIVYPKCKDSGIQTTVKPNELLSAMIMCRNDFHSGVMAYNLVKVLSRKLCIFSCLNLKPGDGFLPYNMPEVENWT